MSFREPSIPANSLMSERPNILIITADHLRADALACNQSIATPSSLARFVQTPNLSRLASEGVNFTHCYTPNPICVPARASITTGNYPHRCTGQKSNGGGIREDQPKLAELFSGAGYGTYAIGKLHYLPYASPGQPRTLNGFQYAELHEEGRILGKFDPLGNQRGLEDYHDWLGDQGWPGHERAHGIGNNDAKPGTSPVPAGLHEEAWVATRSIDALERHRTTANGQPFLLWASFAKPHPPYDPPPPYNGMYDPRVLPKPAGGWDGHEMLDRDFELFQRRSKFGWDWLSPQTVQTIRAHYAGLLSFQDAMIGRILEHLGRQGLFENTIVVFASDHGDLLGDHGRFFKSCMYEGSVRVPLIWRFPGSDKIREHDRHHLAGLQDILPTLCSLAGVPLGQRVDGEDLSPILRDPGAKGREWIVSQTHDGGQKAMIRSRQWKFIWTELGGREELYDLVGDPEELHNLADQEDAGKMLDILRRELIAWCRANGDSGPLDGEGLKSSPFEEKDAISFNASAQGWRRY